MWSLSCSARKSLHLVAGQGFTVGRTGPAGTAPLVDLSEYNTVSRNHATVTVVINGSASELWVEDSSTHGVSYWRLLHAGTTHSRVRLYPTQTTIIRDGSRKTVKKDRSQLEAGDFVVFGLDDASLKAGKLESRASPTWNVHHSPIVVLPSKMDRAEKSALHRAVSALGTDAHLGSASSCVQDGAYP
jgi:hypothetical protein